MAFEVLTNPSDELLEIIEKVTPHNPFNSRAHAHALRAAHGDLVALVVRDGEAIAGGCLAVIEGNVVSRTLRIPSLEVPTSLAQTFWEGLRTTSLRFRLLNLKVETFGSAATEIPDLFGHGERRQRTEFLLELDRAPKLTLSTNHRRRYARAQKMNVSVRRSTDADALRQHHSLQKESFARRRQRGEDVPDVGESAFEKLLIGGGGGELFQAIREGRVLSSILLLRSDTAAYYHSAGTSEEGTDCGASQFLIAETANVLRQEGVRFFNLGGAEPANAGLYRFKDGFGARHITNDEVRFRVGSRWRAKLSTALRLARHDRRGLVRALASIEQFDVFRIDADKVTELHSQSTLMLHRLSADELRRYAESEPWVASHAERAKRETPERIVGLFEGDRLVHIAWVHNAATDRTLQARTLRVREGEAEITNCETAPSARGRGYYPMAISSVCRDLVAETDVRRIFMITSVRNASSRRGIEKAGLRHTGRITRLRLPWLSSRAGYIYRRVRRHGPLAS